MDRQTKLEKINAEIARLEVEMEMEFGGLGVGGDCDRFVGLDLFGGKKSGLTDAARIDMFKRHVLDPALVKLCVDLNLNGQSVPVADAARQDKLASQLSFSGTFSSYKPNAIYTFTLVGREYFVIVFLNDDSVTYRIFKKFNTTPQKTPKIGSIKELKAWGRDRLESDTAKFKEAAGILALRVEALHAMTDEQLSGGGLSK